MFPFGTSLRQHHGKHAQYPGHVGASAFVSYVHGVPLLAEQNAAFPHYTIVGVHPDKPLG